MVAKFVSTTGNNGASGDEGAPWATAAFAIPLLGTSGIDRIVFRGGTHTASGTITVTVSGADINNRLSIEAYTGESPLIQGGNIAIPQSYIRVAGLEHTGGYIGQDAFDKRLGHLYEDLHLHNYNAGLGVAIGLLTLSGCDQAIVRRCILHDMTIGGDFQENAVCLLSYDAKEILVEDSEFYNSRYGCYQKMADSNGGDGMTIRRCRFHDFLSLDGAQYAPSQGVYKSVSGGSEPHFNTLTEFNLFYNCSGIAMEAWDLGTQSTGHVVRNNTIILPANSLTGPTALYLWWFDQVEFYNNIVYSQTGGQSKGQLSTSAAQRVGSVINGLSKCDWNCYFAEGGTSRHWSRDGNDDGTPGGSSFASPAAASATTFANWKTHASSNKTTYVASKDANSLDTDPLFAETTDYTLSPSSPCINAGRVGGTSGGAATDMGWQAEAAEEAPTGKLIVVF